MRRNTVYALIGLAGLSAIGAVIAGSRAPTTPVSEAGDLLFPKFRSAETAAARIEIVSPEARFALMRDGEAWVIPDKQNYPADPANIRRLFVGLANLTTVGARTARPELYDRLNLTDPGSENARSIGLVVKDAAGKELADLVIGKNGPSDPARTGDTPLYVRKPGEARTWLAAGLAAPPTNPVDWANREIVNIAIGDVIRIDIRPTDGKAYSVVRAEGSKDLTLQDLPPGKQVKAQSEVNALGYGVEALAFEDVAKLPSPAPSATSQAVYTARKGLIVTVGLLPYQGQSWAQLSVRAENDAAKDEAARIEKATTGWIFRIPDFKRVKMETKLSDLIADPPKPAGS